MPETRAPGGTTLRLGILDATDPSTDPAILRAAEASDRIEIVAAAAGSTLPARFGSVAKASLDAVIDDPRVEAIYLAPGGSPRPGWVERAARAGKHVLCEPPVATSVADAAAMYAACTQAGVLLAQADAVRFHPRTAALTEFVRSGSIGDVRSITSEHTMAADAGPQTLGAHAALWLLGVDVLPPILDVLPDSIVTAVTTSPTMTTAAVHLTTTGASALALCSLELVDRQELVFRGTEGTIEVDRPFDPGPGHTAFEVRRHAGTVEEVRTGGADPHLAMIEAFADACGGGDDWPTDQDASMALVGKLAEIVATLPSSGDAGLELPGRS